MLLTVMNILLYLETYISNICSPFMTGLSVIQKCNPDATLLAHEKTMHRISRGDSVNFYLHFNNALGDSCKHVFFLVFH